MRNSNSGEKSYLKLDGTPQAEGRGLDSARSREKLFNLPASDLDKMMTTAQSRDFKPVRLPSSSQAHIVSKSVRFESNNVVALLPGADSKAEDEAVMYTAHYDHLGIRPDMPGDNIYNGADDNATGCGYCSNGPRLQPVESNCRAVRLFSLRSPPKSRVCWVRSISASIRRFRPARFRLT